MSKSNHTEAQMIGALKQMEAGRKAEDVAREVGVSKHTIYAWKAKYGGMDVSQAQEAKQLRDSATIRFFNIPIPDRSVPANKDAFLGNVETLAEMVKEGRFLGVHCRASIGRSSVLVVSILVRLGWDANEAFDAVESARGCSIPDTP